MTKCTLELYITGGLKMVRKAFKMKVNADQHQEYYRRHQEIWPEMIEMLQAHGAVKYAIFLDESTSNLFAYLEIEDEDKWDKVTETAINKKWWDYMEPLMQTNEDNSPVTVDLREMFYIDKEDSK